MPCLQVRTEKKWAAEVVHLLERTGETQAELARRLKRHRSGLQHFLRGTRHPTVETVHEINAAMGLLLRNPNVTFYLESLIPSEEEDPDDDGPPHYSVDADPDAGVAMAFGIIEPYLRAGAKDEIMTDWHRRAGTRRSELFDDVNRAWRREVIRSVDGTVPRKLFVEEMTDILEKYGIRLKKWFKPEPAVRKYRALENVYFTTRNALKQTGAGAALRAELEATIMAAVLNYIHADEHNHDLFQPIAREQKT
jgi:transcriptional regulator with XRE-family HTH domain